MVDKLIEKLLKSDKRKVARSISLIEENDITSGDLLKKIFSHTGKSYRIGITGPPGAGKSTITNNLTKFFLSMGHKVGIIAVDPTSPFTGGALLGDRVRMTEIGNDPNVFIRSMATRGSLGGLSRKATDAADILDAAGYNKIILETVGVGQSELDIAKASDTCIVVLVPESGDAVQAMKAGLMEIADFFILNKSDRPGAKQAVSALQTILMMRDHDAESWMPNIIESVASDNKGTGEIAEEIERHKNFMLEKNLFLKKREDHFRIRIKEIVESRLKEELWSESGENSLNLSLEKVIPGNLSPYGIAEKLIDEFKKRI